MATAAHCVCMSSSAIGEESLVDCEGSEIKYDAAKVIEVFVGLNTQDINMAIERNRDLHQRQVEKVRSTYYWVAHLLVGRDFFGKHSTSSEPCFGSRNIGRLAGSCCKI